MRTFTVAERRARLARRHQLAGGLGAVSCILGAALGGLGAILGGLGMVGLDAVLGRLEGLKAKTLICRWFSQCSAAQVGRHSRQQGSGPKPWRGGGRLEGLKAKMLMFQWLSKCSAMQDWDLGLVAWCFVQAIYTPEFG